MNHEKQGQVTQAHIKFNALNIESVYIVAAFVIF